MQPLESPNALQERRDISLRVRPVPGDWDENADAPHPLGLLRTRSRRPRRRRPPSSVINCRRLTLDLPPESVYRTLSLP